MKKIRASLSKKNRMTIALNIDTDSLNALSGKTGILYQRLLNTLLTANATREENIQSRLNVPNRSSATSSTTLRHSAGDIP